MSKKQNKCSVRRSLHSAECVTVRHWEIFKLIQNVSCCVISGADHALVGLIQEVRRKKCSPFEFVISDAFMRDKSRCTRESFKASPTVESFHLFIFRFCPFVYLSFSSLLVFIRCAGPSVPASLNEWINVGHFNDGYDEH